VNVTQSSEKRKGERLTPRWGGGGFGGGGGGGGGGFSAKRRW